MLESTAIQIIQCSDGVYFDRRNDRPKVCEKNENSSYRITNMEEHITLFSEFGSVYQIISVIYS